jgi:hypothetical protein
VYSYDELYTSKIHLKIKGMNPTDNRKIKYINMEVFAEREITDT